MSMATTYPTRNTGRVPNLTSRRIANPARQPGATLAPTRNSAEPFVNVGSLKSGEFTLPVHIESIANCTAAVTPATVVVRIR